MQKDYLLDYCFIKKVIITEQARGEFAEYERDLFCLED